MIKYDRLWETVKNPGETQYDRYTRHNVSSVQIGRLRRNQNVEINAIDRLCNIQQCRVTERKQRKSMRRSASEGYDFFSCFWKSYYNK